MGREGDAAHGVRVRFTACRVFEQPKIYVFMCGGGTALMCRGRNVHDWVRQLDVSPSTCRWSVEVYVSQVPHQGATVVFGYIEVSCERYDPIIYRCIHT